MNELDIQEENKPKRDELGRLLPGHTANPNGRPKGKTIKERVIDWLEEHPSDMEAFVKHFVEQDRALAWRMLEGNPTQATDITSGGEKVDFSKADPKQQALLEEYERKNKDTL